VSGQPATPQCGLAGTSAGWCLLNTLMLATMEFTVRLLTYNDDPKTLWLVTIMLESTLY